MGSSEPLVQKVKYIAIIQALVESRNVHIAAARAGVGTSTIYRYLRREDFNEQYSAVVKELTEQIGTRLANYSHTALEILVEIMTDPKAKESNRLNAAKSVLELAYRSHEQATLNIVHERLNELEGGIR